MTFNECFDLIYKVIWSLGTPIDGYSSESLRSDAYGNAMRREHYGTDRYLYGWFVNEQGLPQAYASATP